VADARPANAKQAQRWNGASGQYWIEHRERHLAEHQHLVPHLFRAAGISPGERVLDVGCGCGTTTIEAARAAQGTTEAPPPRRDPGGVAVGLDLSAPMLEVARQLAAEAGTGNARFVRGDAQARPLRTDWCDAVISSFGVMFFDNPAAAFTSLAAVVRPGGRLAFLCWQDDTENEVFAVPLRAFAARTQLPPPADDLFVDPQRIRDLLSGTGWRDIRVASVTEPAWLGSDVDDVMDYVRGMPMIRDLSTRINDPAATERVLAGVAGEYAARQSADGVWVRAAAWLVTARRAGRRTRSAAALL
jgi:ubiquinone/menaquinone biosynthesis C-methylase UbiE